MKIVYIAGPFRGPTQWDIAENIRAAERWALEVAKLGAMPLCPHTNTANFHGQLSDEFWLEGTMELLRRADAALFIPGWRVSSGSHGEWDYAGEPTNRVKRFEAIADLKKWLEENADHA